LIIDTNCRVIDTNCRVIAAEMTVGTVPDAEDRCPAILTG
jgi:hypothetical protein